MDNLEALQLLEEIDMIRVKSGLNRMDENSRRDFLKKMGVGAAAAAGVGAAALDTSGVGITDFITGEDAQKFNGALDSFGDEINKYQALSQQRPNQAPQIINSINDQFVNLKKQFDQIIRKKEG